MLSAPLCSVLELEGVHDVVRGDRVAPVTWVQRVCEIGVLDQVESPRPLVGGQAPLVGQVGHDVIRFVVCDEGAVDVVHDHVFVRQGDFERIEGRDHEGINPDSKGPERRGGSGRAGAEDEDGGHA